MKQSDYYGILCAIFLVGIHVDNSIAMLILFLMSFVTGIIYTFIERRQINNHEENSEESGS